MSEDEEKVAKMIATTPTRAIATALWGIAKILRDIHGELGRLNDGRDAFQREMAEFFAKLTAKDDDGSLRSGQPAAASGCPVCERPESDGVCARYTPLTRQQWRDHSDAFQYRMERMGATRLDAPLWAERVAETWFGPCPEDSP